MALPVTTIVPFAQLPGCATGCGPLYDANGACVPPHVAAADDNTYASCFCAYGELQPFSTGTGGVCDAACPGNAAGLSSIVGWFTSFCNGKGVAPVTTVSTSTMATTTPGSGNKGPTGPWISTHWQWVVMLAVMILSIVGIWVGACIWRRRYLRRRDRQYALGKNLATQTASGRIVPNPSQPHSIHAPSAGLFNPAPISAAGVYDPEKQVRKEKERKKWVVNERT